MFEFFEDQVLIDVNRRVVSRHDNCSLKRNVKNEQEEEEDDEDSKDTLVIKEEAKFVAHGSQTSHLIKNEHDYNSKKINLNEPSGSPLNKQVEKFQQVLLKAPGSNSAPIVPTRSVPISSSKQTLKHKLFGMYVEESQKNNKSMFVNHSTHILSKIVKSGQYNMLVLNLYDVEKGFSIGFRVADKHNQTNEPVYQELNNLETKILSYSENELLYYINGGEIPPILIDLVDRLNIRLFYDGCLIMEIRDHRRKLINKNYETHYVLLQPSMQTLLADLNSITNSGNFIWTQEDKYSLESQLLLATMPPLCLNPSPIVSIMKNKLNFHKLKLNEPSLKRHLTKFDWQFNVNRSTCKWKDFVLPYPFRIMKIRKKYSNDYLNFNKTSIPPSNDCASFLKFESDLVSSDKSPTRSLLNKNEYKLPIDEMILVKKFSKRGQSVNYSNEYSLVPIEEIVLEAVDKFSINNYSRLLIKRRPFDGVYFCELSPNFNTDQRNQAQFRLGEASEAEKYIQQYLKIFTEEGRRAVTIKHNLIERPSENRADDESNIFYSTLKKPVNSSPVLSGLPFNNYFDSKLSLSEFNDKQLHAYQLFLQQQFKQQHQQKQQQTNNEALFQQVKRIKTASKEDYKPAPLAYPSTQINSSTSSTNSSPRTFTNIQPARSQTDTMQNTKLQDILPATNNLSLNNSTTNKPNSLIALNLINNKSFQNQVVTNQNTNIINSSNTTNSNTSGNGGCENVPAQSIITSRMGTSTILPKTNITSLIAKQNNSTNICNNVNNTINRNANGGFVQIYVPKLVQPANPNVPVVDSTNNSNNSTKPKFQIIRL